MVIPRCLLRLQLCRSVVVTCLPSNLASLTRLRGNHAQQGRVRGIHTVLQLVSSEQSPHPATPTADTWDKDGRGFKASKVRYPVPSHSVAVLNRSPVAQKI
ncbi:hypothetical protein B0O80DRAFT_452191 [Mortierella sp. GBAus27b]|nr:hypothetical protein B0O80DRAFT_452191 [Mortierella sp. GBAus27b]